MPRILAPFGDKGLGVGSLYTPRQNYFPFITSPASAAYVGNTSFSYQITATGNSLLSFGATNLPAGLTVNPSTGLISGTMPSGTTLYSITVSATNPVGTATKTVDLVSSVPEYIWYKINETSGTTLTDSGVNGYTATLNGTYTLNGGLVLNAAGWAETPTLPGSYRQGSVTFSAWCKTQNRGNLVSGGFLPSRYPPNIISNDVPGQGGNGFGANIWVDAGVTTSEYINGINFVSMGAGTVSTDWEFLAYTFNLGSNTLTMFKNGVSIYSVGGIGAPTNVANTIKIGRHNFDTGAYPGDKGFYSGTIKDVRIYGRALSAAEVLALYNLGPA